MSVNDPIADMLTRIRNAAAVRQDFVMVPASRMKRAIAQVLKDEGFVARFEQTRDKQFPMLKIYLKYTERKESILRGMKRVSKPGCRIYTKQDRIPWVQSGMGTVILSTPRGVVSGAEARRLGVGGEVLCEVW
jgi:small subunit ribosomal protein S8